MDLINKIINDLLDDEKSISGALFKTKVLASQINNNELLDWVNNELNGYASSQLTPSYRRTTSEIKGSYLNGQWKYSGQLISIGHLDAEIYKEIKTVIIVDSVAALEELTKKEHWNFKISVNAETKTYIENSIRALGNHYYQILSIYREISPTFTINILTTVRSKLLDFILAIQKEFGLNPEIENLKSNKSKIKNIFKTTINSQGNGNILNTGKENSLKSANSFKKKI